MRAKEMQWRGNVTAFFIGAPDGVCFEMIFSQSEVLLFSYCGAL